jgi:hypothetical protein
MAGPKIIVPDYGYHNKDLDASAKRLEKSQSHQDLSTIIISPTRGMIPARVVQSWQGLIKPMNQKIVGPMFAIGMEVGRAYDAMIESILANPDLAQFKFLLTIEEDNCPPPDGLIKLYEGMDDFDVIGGLYWTKGPGGQPMIYGDPKVMPRNFIPQIPIQGTIQPANGLGMGFTLFKLDMFKKLPKPWFKTCAEIVPGKGVSVYTQDLYFFENASKAGFKFASDNRILVGHYDHAGSFGQPEMMW